ncbi:MAG: thiamine pyrophosphate-binding protein, partial [Spirochaetes bacterium]|nr:thiamine pyrophosphate-binding protein [Spirochaetota bacterium]
MRINGGHIIGKYLSRRNVKFAFGISGGHIEALLDGLQQYGIRSIDVRHEQAAVMMAHALAVYTGNP